MNEVFQCLFPSERGSDPLGRLYLLAYRTHVSVPFPLRKGALTPLIFTMALMSGLRFSAFSPSERGSDPIIPHWLWGKRFRPRLRETSYKP